VAGNIISANLYSTTNATKKLMRTVQFQTTLTNSTEQSSSWEANIGNHSRNSPLFMELEGSLPNSQEPATCPYPDPD
jgi:hypothetical protein